MRYLPTNVRVQFIVPYGMGKERQPTNSRKISIDRPEHHDRRDAVQTDHAENKNAAHGGRYDN